MARSRSADTFAEEPHAGAPDAVATLKYEAALLELESIIQRMETGQLPLEESIEAYRRGSELIRHCQRQLSEAERKVQILENDGLHDFDGTSEGAA